MKKFLFLIFVFLTFPYFILASDRVEINTASLKQLETLTGIGPVKAQAIIDARPFLLVDDLIRVSGIGEKTLQKIKDQGLAYVDKQTEQAATEESVEMPAESPAEAATEEPAVKIYASGILINEILPSPEGSDATEEWIEIFNQNSFEVDLSDWKISDTEGVVKIYTFPKGTKISAQGFFVLTRPESKITLNNDGDGLNLIQPDGKIINSVSYEKAPSGHSYNRIPPGWVWSTVLTPGSENIIPAQEAEETKPLKELEKIDINTASLEDLVKIVHIGEVRVQELISLRSFYSLDDLTRIRGIGDKALEEIKKQGLAWVDPELKPPQSEKTEPREMGLAAVAGPFNQGHPGRQIPKSLSVFLIALGLAIFSGIIIFILKKKLRNASDTD
jgi:competence ComEA-like helix-hairpin-helix protein